MDDRKGFREFKFYEGNRIPFFIQVRGEYLKVFPVMAYNDVMVDVDRRLYLFKTEELAEKFLNETLRDPEKYCLVLTPEMSTRHYNITWDGKATGIKGEDKNLKARFKDIKKKFPNGSIRDTINTITGKIGKLVKSPTSQPVTPDSSPKNGGKYIKKHTRKRNKKRNTNKRNTNKRNTNKRNTNKRNKRNKRNTRNIYKGGMRMRMRRPYTGRQKALTGIQRNADTRTGEKGKKKLLDYHIEIHLPEYFRVLKEEEGTGNVIELIGYIPDGHVFLSEPDKFRLIERLFLKMFYYIHFLLMEFLNREKPWNFRNSNIDLKRLLDYAFTRGIMIQEAQEVDRIFSYYVQQFEEELAVAGATEQDPLTTASKVAKIFFRNRNILATYNYSVDTLLTELIRLGVNSREKQDKARKIFESYFNLVSGQRAQIIEEIVKKMKKLSNLSYNYCERITTSDDPGKPPLPNPYTLANL